MYTNTRGERNESSLQVECLVTSGDPLNTGSYGESEENEWETRERDGVHVCREYVFTAILASLFHLIPDVLSQCTTHMLLRIEGLNLVLAQCPPTLTHNWFSTVCVSVSVVDFSSDDQQQQQE